MFTGVGSVQANCVVAAIEDGLGHPKVVDILNAYCMFPSAQFEACTIPDDFIRDGIRRQRLEEHRCRHYSDNSN